MISVPISPGGERNADLRARRGSGSPLITGVAISPDSRWAATGSDDGTITLWHLQLAELARLAQAAAGRNLTLDEWQQYFPGQRPYRRTFLDLPGPKFEQRYGELARNLTLEEWHHYFPGEKYRKTFPGLPGPEDQVIAWPIVPGSPWAAVVATCVCLFILAFRARWLARSTLAARNSKQS
jgi:hypothetical protein